ncbi:hypothetical protein WAI453_004468 [Rhynchosporium graminicola]
MGVRCVLCLPVFITGFMEKPDAGVSFTVGFVCTGTGTQKVEENFIMRGGSVTGFLTPKLSFLSLAVTLSTTSLNFDDCFGTTLP